MRSTDFASLDVACYELRLSASCPISLPLFLGGTLRGAFGHSLKRAICVMPYGDCERCMLRETCAYSYLFESSPTSASAQLRGQKDAPRPFILAPPLLDAATCNQKSAPKGIEEVEGTRPLKTVAAIGSQTCRGSRPQGSAGLTVKPRLVKQSLLPKVSATARDYGQNEETVRRHFSAGEGLTFGLTVLGRANDFLPYLIYAVSQMAEAGLGVDRGRFELREAAAVRVTGERSPIYSGATRRMSATLPEAKGLSEWIASRMNDLSGAARSPEAEETVRLRFLTPARIKSDGDLQTQMNFELLVRSLLRRVSMLAELYGSARLALDYSGLIKRAGKVETVSETQWEDVGRYSSRQKAKMKFGSLVGDVVYRGEAMREFLPLLIAGEILHAGSKTTFGLGKYEIVT